MSVPRKPILVRPVGQTKNEINVTPLVDVVLVLLIIFMVVMPLLEKELSVRIPVDEKVEAEPPSDQIVVGVDRSGAFTINGEITSPETYVDTLHARLSTRRKEDRIVFVTPEDEALYKKLVEALDGARRAGAETLGMLPDPPAAAPAP